MLHNKSVRLMSPSEYTQRIAAQALNHVARMQTTPTGTIVTHNADGTKTIAGPVLGTDSTGTSVTTATHVGDTTPPGVPTGVTAWSGDGSLHVSWDGTLAGGIPADFDHVTLYARTGTDTAITLGTLAAAGSVTSSAVVTGTTYSVTATSEDDACAIDGTAAHNVSAACSAISVTVTDVAGNTDQHFWWDADGAHASSTGDHDLSGANLLLTSAKLAFRNALSELFSIVVSGTSAVISFLGGKFEFAYKANSSGVDEATISSPSGILVTSESSNTAEYHHTLTTAEGAEGFLPAGTILHGYANISPYDDLAGTHGQMLLDCKQTDGTENMLNISLDTGCKLNGTQSEPRISIFASTKDGSAAAVSYDVSTTIRRLITAIQPVVLYNGGNSLDYDTAPGSGTTGTVTLSETAANFRKLTIWGDYCGMQAATTLASPNGRECTLQLFVPDAGPASMVYIKSSRLKVSGTSITNSGWVAMWLSASTNHFDATSAPEIAIVRVEGRR